MGGPGSGKCWWKTTKLTVEECLPLDINKLVRDGLIFRGYASGSLTWTRTSTGEQSASAGFELEPVGETGLIFRLIYTITIRGEAHEVDEPIHLTTTEPHFGGIRWWFVCPLTVNGQFCGRRVGKLYVPPRAKYFGCRHCHDLTYRSCQESHKFDAMYAYLGRKVGLPPREVKKLLEDGL